jgi:predicted deacylase
VSRIPLMNMSPGTARSLMVHRFGAPAARPKAYLQAALHADEIPGMLVLQHLIARLMKADAAGEILGEIVIVPFANPIGLSQRSRGDLLGRYEFRAGGNFNRGFPYFDEAIGDRVEGKLGTDADENITLIRAAFMAEIEAYPATNELLHWRREVMRLAGDADFVFDLHCDSEAILYLYLGTQNWPSAADLSAQMGSLVTLLTHDSGGGSFDETFSRPWWTLAQRFGDDTPIPPACLSATIELRGTADVDDDLAAGDADNLYRFFQRRGLIAGDPGLPPKALCDATPLDGVDYVVAPSAGIVTYLKAPGDRIEAGETVAILIDPAAENPATARIALKSKTAGTLFGRHLMKFAIPGERICTVAGAEPLPDPEDWSKLEE